MGEVLKLKKRATGKEVQRDGCNPHEGKTTREKSLGRGKKRNLPGFPAVQTWAGDFLGKRRMKLQ